MANAQVEKMKALGMRHGEKVVVTLAGVLCVLCLFWAATKPTIEITPDQVSKDAQAAQSSLSRNQPAADIQAAIESQGVKSPEFAKLVEEQEKNALNPGDYKVVRSWVTPEPGAGLIRDTPELLAPEELYAYPGRGGALLYELVDGKRVPEDPATKKEDEGATSRRHRKRRRAASGGSSMMMGSSMTPGMAPLASQLTDEQKKQIALEEAKRGLFSGKAGADEEKKAEGPAAQEGPFKEVTRGLRYVSITGVLNHKKLQDNYLNALKNPAVAHPNYLQLDVERQVKAADGTWSDWEAVDAEKNHEITYNLPEEEEELTPENVRLAALVDPLPFLKAGYWERVHVASLVPKEKREIDKAAMSAAMSSSMAGPGGSSSGSSASMSMAPPMMGGAPGMSSMPSSSSMMGGMDSSASVETADFPKSDAPKVMIRSLDFTVEPDTTYRFRLRVVVLNPNFNREDVTPGTDTKSLKLNGPWSEPTNEVTMPADVTAYAMRKVTIAPNAKRNDKVTFQIVRWNPEDGVTVTRNIEYGVGQIVGEQLTTRIPTSDGTGAKPKPIDYNSHQLLIDESGGDQPLAQVGGGGAKLDVPAVSLLLRPDGSVALRNEAFDVTDPVRKDIADNYNREIEESSKRRENSTGMSGMMGSMMGGGRR